MDRRADPRRDRSPLSRSPVRLPARVHRRAAVPASSGSRRASTCGGRGVVDTRRTTADRAGCDGHDAGRRTARSASSPNASTVASPSHPTRRRAMSLDEPEGLLGALQRAIDPVRRPNPAGGAVALAIRDRAPRRRVGFAARGGSPDCRPRCSPSASTALALLTLVVPPVRRFAWRRVRAIVLQHRLRTAFVRARVHSNAGRIPVHPLDEPAQSRRPRPALPPGRPHREVRRVRGGPDRGCLRRDARRGPAGPGPQRPGVAGHRAGVTRHIDASIVSSFAVVSASSAEGTDAGTRPAPA